MTIQLNYNQYSLMGRLKFSVDYKDLLNGYKKVCSQKRPKESRL